MVSQLKFDPNGKRFFSAGLDGKLKSWKTKNSISDDLIFLSKVKIHEEGVSCLLIKDNQLITGSLDENLKIWEFGPFQKEFLEKNRQKNILGKIPEEIFTMEISKDKKFLASSGAGSTIFFFDIDSKSKTFSNIKKAIPWHKEAVYDLKLDFSANNLFSAGGDGTIGLWNFNPNSKEFSNKIIQFNAHAAKVIKLLVGKDGKRLFSASYDGTIKIWDQDQLLQGKNILLAKINNVGVNTKDLTSDKNETLLFHGDEQGKLSIYDIDQKSKSYLSLISSFNLTNQRINSLLAYYNKGKQYLFIGADGSLYLYEIINNANLQIKLLLEKKVHFAEINQIKIKEFKLINNKKQKYLITASSDKTLGIWNIRF